MDNENKRTLRIIVTSIGLAPTLASGAIASLLFRSDWFRVAHISESETGDFDGNGDLLPPYSFDPYTSENQTDDFGRTFDVWDGMDFLFIAGKENVWGLSDYLTLRASIDATSAVLFGLNFFWDVTSGNASGVDANILIRSGVTEDHPGGEPFCCIGNSEIIWDENDYVGSNHANLRNQNGCENVWGSFATCRTPCCSW